MLTQPRGVGFLALSCVLIGGCRVPPDGGGHAKSQPALPPWPSQTATVVTPSASFDFENGIQGWTPRCPQITIDTSAAAAHESAAGLHVRGEAPTGWNYVSSPPMPVKPGKWHRASLWLRVESCPPGSRPLSFKIEFTFADAKNSGRVTSPTGPAGEKGVWRQLSVEFLVPDGCSQVWAALEKGTDAPCAVDVSMDDFLMGEIDMPAAEFRMKTAALAGPITGELRNTHPRIYLSAAKIAQLRAETPQDPRWAAARKTLFAIADNGVRRGPPDYKRQTDAETAKRGEPDSEQLWQREVGNMIPHLALAYRLSDDRRYLDAAKAWVYASLGYPTWGLKRTDGMDLATGHQLTGIGLAYDWLYHDLTETERAQIREGLAKRATPMAVAAAAGTVWWHGAYMQNHQWVNSAGFATAGFALYGEVDAAAGWVRVAHDKFVTTLATLGDDGASHEGYGYWEYGAEYIMRYLEMSRDLLGIDLYHDENGANQAWLSRNPLYALYLVLPRNSWTKTQSAIDIGDCPRSHWYGPSYLLRNLARRYPQEPNSGVAQWLARQMETSGADASSSGHYLNFAWYEPAIPEVPPTAMPTLHHFEDIGIVSARSGWNGDESLLIVKCGPPLGNRHADTPFDYGAGHVHPDAGSVLFVAAGEFILRDDGYAHPKTTAGHSSVLVNGRGQKGEGRAWFDFGPWATDRRAPRIRSAESAPTVDRIVCDVAPAYPLDLGLQTFTREVVFTKPDRLTVRDELAAAGPRSFEWRFPVDGALERTADGVYRVKGKKVVAELRFSSPVTLKDSVVQEKPGQSLSIVTAGNQERVEFVFECRVLP